MIKRVLSLCIALIMMFGLMSIPVFAEEESVVFFIDITTTNTKELKQGEEFTYTVSIGAVENLGVLEFYLDIPEGIEFISAVVDPTLKNTLDSEGEIAIPTETNGYKWSYSAGKNGYTGKEKLVLVSVNCKVKDDCQIGSTKELSIKLQDLYKNDLSGMKGIPHTVTINVTPAKIELKSVKLFDGDKEVTSEVFIKNGSTKILTIKLDPENATYNSISMYATTSEIVSIPETFDFERSITAKKVGTTKVTVKVSTDELETVFRSCEITVTVTEPTHEHILTLHEAKEATCTEDGNKAYWTCENCKKLFLDSEGKTETTLEVVTIKATGHSYGALIPATKAVHTKDELTPSVDAHYKCSACGKLFIDKDGEKVETTLDAITGEKPTHNPSEEWSYDDNNHWHKCTGCDIKLNETEHNFIWKIDTEATEDKEGSKHEECECGKKRNENTTIGKLDHTHTNITHHPAVAATCTETGNKEYWTCLSNKCSGKYYSDNKCANEIDGVIETEINPNNHTDENLGKWIDKVSPIHSENERKAGVVGHYSCKCGKNIAADKKTVLETIEIPAPEHSFTEKWNFDQSQHWQEKVCDCGKTEEVSDTRTNHEYVDAKWGYIGKDGHAHICQECFEKANKYVMEKLEPHTDEDGDNVCDKCGYSMHTHDFSEAWTSNETHHWHECTGCDDIADKAEHIPSGWIVDREATHSRDGKMHRECKVCGYILEKSVIEAEGSDFDYSAWYYARQQLLNQTFRITAKAGVGGTITDEGTTGVKFGNSITYKITPDAGYEIEAVYVDGKNIGAVDEFTFSDVRGNAEISVTFKKSEKAPAIEAIDEDNSEVIDEAEEIVEAWVNPFIDIFESDDCYEAVRFVYENGIFRGVSENEFAPATTMTRAMFVTVLGRLAAVDESAFSGTSFSDVPAGEWYSAYVEWASRNGIVNGYGDDTFGPNDEITVEQAAVIIARYAEFMGVEVESETTLDGFADAADVADWAADQMAWAVENGIYNTEEFLNPKAPASRSLIAEMLYAFSELN